MTAVSAFMATKNAIMVAINALMAVVDVFMVAMVVFMAAGNTCLAPKNATVVAKNATMALLTSFMAPMTTFLAQVEGASQCSMGRGGDREGFSPRYRSGATPRPFEALLRSSRARARHGSHGQPCGRDRAPTRIHGARDGETSKAHGARRRHLGPKRTGRPPSIATLEARRISWCDDGPVGTSPSSARKRRVSVASTAV